MHLETRNHQQAHGLNENEHLPKQHTKEIGGQKYLLVLPQNPVLGEPIFLATKFGLQNSTPG